MLLGQRLEYRGPALRLRHDPRLWVFLLFCCMSCGEPVHPNAEPKERGRVPVQNVAFSETDSGREVCVQVGQAIVVRLPENPTTGFEWAVRGMDSATLSLQSTSYSPESAESAGRGGVRTFEIKARAPGRAPLLLELRRPWEPDAEAASSFELDLSVSACEP